MSGTGTKGGGYHHGDLREALLDAGETILSEKGPDAISLREIARACGVSQTAPYRHFKDKASLMQGIATRAFQEFGTALGEAVAEGKDPRSSLELMGRAYVAYGMAHPHRLRLMFSGDGRDGSEDSDLSAAAVASFKQLQDGIGGVVGGEGSDKEAAAIAAWSMVHGYTMLKLNMPVGPMADSGGDQQDMLGRILRILTQGLAPKRTQNSGVTDQTE